MSNADDMMSAVGVSKVLNPDGLSVYVDIDLLYQKNSELGKRILSSAAAYYDIEEEVRQRIISHKQDNQRYRLRITNLPNTIPLSSLTQLSYENRIAQFMGIVTQVTPVRKLTSKKVYKCRFCHNTREFRATTVAQMLAMPKKKMNYVRCTTCKFAKATPQDLVPEDCLFVPMQRIVLQEILEEVSSGKSPAKIIAYLLDDLAGGKVKVGDQLTVVGTIHPDIKESASSYSVYAEILSFEKQKSSFDEIKFTMKDMDDLKKLAEDPKVYDNLIASFAPTIYGYPLEKLALLCSLFGAPRIIIDSTEKRGDCHILLTGDPSTAKSMMIDWATKLSPRGITASGRGASSAGLTAAWIKGLDGLPEVEPGALVIADGGGLVAVDEIDKMNPVDRMSIHRPMEQQKVNIIKAGVIQEFNSRCSIIAAANPKQGRYDPNRSLLANIDLDPALLSRFDLVFVMRDIPSLETEEKLAEHILRTYSGKARVAPISMDMLRKYVAYARLFVNPIIDPNSKAFSILKQGYLDIRMKKGGDIIPPTPRQLEGLARLSMALARMQLTAVVDEVHARMALDLYAASAKPITLDIEETPVEPNVKMTPSEAKVWAAIVSESQGVSKILIKKIRNMHPGKEDLVDKTIEDAISDGRLEPIGEEHIKVVGK